MVSSSTPPAWRRLVLAAAAVGALVTIGALTLAPGSPAVVWVAKPVTTALLALLAATTRAPLSAAFRLLITLGLLASLAGDVLLMLPEDRFTAGLAAFLVAHVAYLAAFASRAPLLRHRSGVVGYAAVATVVLALVLPAVGGVLRTAIIAYVIVIALMAAQATSWLLDEPASRAARLAAIGASCFVASDALLALDRFVFIVPARDLLVLAPYWIAQACIALSVERPPPPSLRL
jgi:uncharacterized membrane protein YhhN